MTLIEVFALSHLYLGAGIGYVQDPPRCPPNEHFRWDQNEVDNPLGIAVIGYEWNPTPRISFSVEVRHQSFIPVYDYGQNSVQVMGYWRPFKR